MSTNIQIIEQYLQKPITSWYEVISKWRDYEVILYEGIIYRFPRLGKELDMELEKRKLDTIRPYISLEIPQLSVVDNTFIMYPVLTWKTFDDANRTFTEEAIATLAWFMKELHTIPLKQFDFMHPPSEQTAEQKSAFQNWVQSMKEDIHQRLVNKVPILTINQLHSYMDELFFEYTSPRQAFVHTDIQGKNIIYNPETNKITGIIDFTDSRIGWIELDFCHFAFVNDVVLEKIVTLYFWCANPEYMERIRFLAKRSVLWEITNDDVYNARFEYVLDRLQMFGFL